MNQTCEEMDSVERKRGVLLCLVVVLCLQYLLLTSTSSPMFREEDELEFILPKHNNERPIVGILTQPDMDGREYVAASYVKYVEAAGARVIAIRYW